ncbi:MAG: protein kinase [Myxococcales bacterium]
MRGPPTSIGSAAAGDATERFDILAEVGAGAFARVFRARDKLDGREVALKVCSESAPAGALRFEREALLLAKLEHEHIVSYVAHGRCASGAYLAMEWLEGETLQQRLVRGPLSADEVAQVARASIAGLQFIARAGIVHKDIKPSNLFLVAGRVERAKILDFGVARSTGDAAITQAGVVMGTPFYMSPEQARGLQNLESSSDIFSLGSVLYECLTGSRPFDGGTMIATLARICVDDFVRIPLLRPQVSSRLASLIHAMLSKDPAARPTHEAVLHALADLDHPNGPATLPVVPWQQPRVHDALAGATGGSPRPLATSSQQRVMCLMVIAGHMEAVTRVPGQARSADEPTQVFDPHGGRRIDLVNGTSLLIFDNHAAPAEQALVAARCALHVRELWPQAAAALCTGRASIDGSLPYGDVCERASQIIDSVEPGTVALCETTAGYLGGRFKLGERDHRALLLEEVRGGEVPRTLFGRRTPFVGRNVELAQLSMSFRACADAGRGRAVLVTAPAGAGKSRLRFESVEAFRQSHPDLTLLHAAGDALLREAPFASIASSLRVLLQLEGTDSPAQKRAKLRRRLTGILVPERVDSVEWFLAELTAAPFPEGASAQLDAARRDPQVLADRVQGSLLDWIEAECRAAPVVLVMEDLHWSDFKSIQLCEKAIRRMEDLPFFVLALARPEVREQHPTLWSRCEFTEIRLPRLDRRACAELLDASAPTEIDEAMRTNLLERADGNPFLLEELLRSAHQRGFEGGIPDSVLGVVQSRLDALGHSAKEVVGAASVLGESFRLDALRALLGTFASSSAFAPCLERLLEQEVLFRHHAGDEGAYAFRHALICEAAYALLSESACQHHHHAAATFMETLGLGEPAVIADHFERARAPERAIPWYKQAAERAFDASSTADAISLCERAFACGATGELGGQLAALVAESNYLLANYVKSIDWAQRAHSLLRPGAVGWWRAAMAWAAAGSERGLEDLEGLANSVLGTAIAKHTAQEAVGCLGSMTGVCVLAGKLELAERLAARLEACGLSGHDRADALAFYGKSVVALYQGNLGRALTAAREEVACAERTGLAWNRADASAMLGVVLCDIGAYDESESVWNDAMEFSRRADMPTYVGLCLESLGLLWLQRGNLSKAVGLLESALRIFEQHGAVQLRVFALVGLARERLLSDDCDRAIALASEILLTEGAPPGQKATALAVKAMVELRQGRLVEARLAIATATSHVRGGHVEQGAFIRRVQLECGLAAGPAQAAQDAVKAALSWVCARVASLPDLSFRTCMLTADPDIVRILQLMDAQRHPERVAGTCPRSAAVIASELGLLPAVDETVEVNLVGQGSTGHPE